MHLDWLHRLHPAPLQAFVGDGPSQDQLRASLHVRDARGNWERGGRAARRIAAAIPVLMPLSAAARLPGMKRLVDATYIAVANNRASISRVLRLDSCAPRLRRIGPEQA
jgi:predicted DCC family thiol-disulfide oxidoreductase YuxK